MTHAVDREEMLAQARLYRADETARLAAEAATARARAERLKDQWRTESGKATAMMRTAKKLGARDGYKGAAYHQAFSDAHAQLGYARTIERLHCRAELAAQATERAWRRRARASV